MKQTRSMAKKVADQQLQNNAKLSWVSSEPAKMTSDMSAPRKLRGDCSPMHHRRASTTLDLPLPLGPTTHETPGPNWKVVRSGKDLKPNRSRREMRTTAE